MAERLKDDSESKNAVGRWPTALRVGLALSVTWLLLLLSYVTIRWSEIAALKPNEVGDFFSGAAAPLAFLWLVVATFLQMEELRAQREELKHSVTHLGTSAEAHKQAQQSSALDRADRDLDERLGLLATTLISAADDMFIIIGAPQNVPHYLIGNSAQLRQLKKEDLDEFFSSAARHAEDVNQSLSRKHTRDHLHVQNASVIGRIHGEILTFIEDAEASKSSIWKRRLSTLRLDRLKDVLGNLISIIEASEK